MTYSWTFLRKSFIRVHFIANLHDKAVIALEILGSHYTYQGHPRHHVVADVTPLPHN